MIFLLLLEHSNRGRHWRNRHRDLELFFLGWTHWNWASNTEPFSGRQDNIPLPHWSWPNMYLKHLFWPLHFENKNMKTSRHCLGEKTLKTHFSNQVSTVTKDQSGTIFNSSHSSTKKKKTNLHFFTPLLYMSNETWLTCTWRSLSQLQSV